jgi:hypothetical protein
MMPFLLRLSVFFLLSFSGIAFVRGQTAEDSSRPASPGNITFHTPAPIDSLERASRGREELQGYRIQIFLGSAGEAKAVRTKFMSLGTGLTCNMVQNIPSYAIRVGDFRTALDAHRELSAVKAHYPAAFVVQDKINPPRLKPREQ